MVWCPSIFFLFSLSYYRYKRLRGSTHHAPIAFTMAAGPPYISKRAVCCRNAQLKAQGQLSHRQTRIFWHTSHHETTNFKQTRKQALLKRLQPVHALNSKIHPRLLRSKSSRGDLASCMHRLEVGDGGFKLPTEFIKALTRKGTIHAGLFSEFEEHSLTIAVITRRHGRSGNWRSSNNSGCRFLILPCTFLHITNVALKWSKWAWDDKYFPYNSVAVIILAIPG